MTTFDSFIEKTKELGIAAAKKSENVAEQLKIQVKLSETVKKIDEKSALVGTAYYYANKEGIEVECADLLSELDALYEEKVMLEKELATLKGNVKCENCGFNNAKNAQYCQKCGFKL